MADIPWPTAPQGGGMLGGGQGPLDTFGKFAQIQNMLNQNQLFQQQFQANKALGPILQQSVDPRTGEIDYVKATMLMAMNPATAFKAQEFASNALLRQKTQFEVLEKQLSLGMKRMEAFGQAASSLIPEAETLVGTPEGTEKLRSKILGKIGELYGEGMLDRKSAIDMLAKLPKDGPGLLTALQQSALRAMSAKDSMAMIQGAMVNLDLGNRVVPVQQSTITGTRAQTVMGPNGPELLEFAKGPNPGTMTSGLVNVGGQQVGVVNDPSKGPRVAGATVANTPTPADMNQLTPVPLTDADAKRMGYKPGTVLYVPRTAIAPMVEGSGGQIPGTGAGGGGRSQAGMGESEAKALTSRAEKGEAYRSDLAEQVDLNNSVMNIVNTVRPVLNNIRTGGFAENRAAFAQVVQGFGDILVQSGNMDQKKLDSTIKAIVDGKGDAGLADTQYVMKNMLQIATANVKASFGAGKITNLEWSKLSSLGNANIDMDKKAIENIFNYFEFTQGIKAAEQALYEAWTQSGQTSSFRPWFQRQLEDAGVVKYGSADLSRLNKVPKTELDAEAVAALKQFAAKPASAAPSSPEDVLQQLWNR